MAEENSRKRIEHPKAVYYSVLFGFTLLNGFLAAAYDPGAGKPYAEPFFLLWWIGVALFLGGGMYELIRCCSEDW